MRSDRTLELHSATRPRVARDSDEQWLFQFQADAHRERRGRARVRGVMRDVDETASDGHCRLARDEVGELGIAREVVTKIVEPRRWRVWVGLCSDLDHRARALSDRAKTTTRQGQSIRSRESPL